MKTDTLLVSSLYFLFGALIAALANTQNYDPAASDSLTIVTGDEILDRLEDITRTFTYL